MSTPGNWEEWGLIPLIYPQIPALEWLWGALAWLGLFPGRSWLGGCNAGREGNAREGLSLCWESRAGKSREPTWTGSL